MKNEFAENDELNTAINTIYQAMYEKSDKGVKNGETSLNINSPQNANPQQFAEDIKQYFNSVFSNPVLKKYYIAISITGSELQINFKWGHHAIVANTAENIN